MRLTIGYYTAIFSLGLAVAVLGPTLPDLAQRTHTDLGQISVLFTALALGYMLGALQGGRWYDRLPGHTVLTVGLVAMVLALVLTPLMPSLLLLAVVMLFLGAGEGVVDAGSNTLLLWVYRDRVGPWMNGLHFCFGLGALLAPVVTAQMTWRRGGLTWAYWTLAVLMLPGALWLYRLPSPAMPQSARDRPQGQQKRLLVVLLALFAALYVGVETGFGGWIFSYAVARQLSDTSGAAYLTAAFWGSLTLGRLLGVGLATRLQPSTIMLVDLVGCVASTGLIMLDASSAVLMWLGTCGLGVFMASIFPTLLIFAERHTTITGQVTGALLVGASVGGMLLPWLIGQRFASIGPGVLPVTILVTLMVAAVVFAGAMGFARREPLPQRRDRLEQRLM